MEAGCEKKLEPDIVMLTYLTTEEMGSAWSPEKGSQRPKIDSVHHRIKKLKSTNILSKIITHACPEPEKKRNDVHNYTLLVL